MNSRVTDIFCANGKRIQESSRDSANSIWYSPRDSGDKTTHDEEIMLAGNDESALVDGIPVNSRSCCLKRWCVQCNLSVTSSYASTDGKTDMQKGEFYDALAALICRGKCKYFINLKYDTAMI